MRQLGAIQFALMRLLSAAVTLFSVIVIAFLMMRAAPGGPFDDVREPHPATAAAIERYYRLDDPLLMQLGRYLGGLLRGDLGPAFRADQSVSGLIAQTAPYSMQLGALSLGIALLIGIGAGILAALYRNTLSDRLITGVAITGISVPVFVVAPLTILAFAVHLDWLPASWTGADDWTVFVLPLVALSLPQIAYLARLMRGSMIEVLGSDFVRTARAQGLDTFAVVRRHALKPALLPLLSYMGPAAAGVLTGSVVVEQIFGIPGLSQEFINGAGDRDYTVVLGIVIVYATLVITLNLLVDICYGFLDPRIRRR